MLEISNCNGKPNYEMAPAENLVLYDCEYPAEILQWKNDEKN